MSAKLNLAAKPNMGIKITELEIDWPYRVQSAEYVETRFQKKAIKIVLETGASLFLPGRMAVKIDEEDMRALNSAKIFITYKGQIEMYGKNVANIHFSE